MILWQPASLSKKSIPFWLISSNLFAGRIKSTTQVSMVMRQSPKDSAFTLRTLMDYWLSMKFRKKQLNLKKRCWDLAYFHHLNSLNIHWRNDSIILLEIVNRCHNLSLKSLLRLLITSVQFTLDSISLATLVDCLMESSVLDRFSCLSGLFWLAMLLRKPSSKTYSTGEIVQLRTRQVNAVGWLLFAAFEIFRCQKSNEYYAKETAGWLRSLTSQVSLPYKEWQDSCWDHSGHKLEEIIQILWKKSKF